VEFEPGTAGGRREINDTYFVRIRDHAAPVASKYPVNGEKPTTPCRPPSRYAIIERWQFRCVIGCGWLG